MGGPFGNSFFLEGGGGVVLKGANKIKIGQKRQNRQKSEKNWISFN